MAIQKFFKIINPDFATTNMSSSVDTLGHGSVNWYTRLVRGSYSRVKRYTEYDIMDTDVDVARALDLIAEEMTGNRGKRDLPVDLHVDNEFYKVSTSTISTLKSALKTWCKVQSLHKRLFGIARTMIKYGDCFFIRDNKGAFKKLVFIHPKYVEEAKVNIEDVYDVKGWVISTSYKDSQANYGSQLLIPVNFKNSEKKDLKEIDNKDMVRFTLSDDLNQEAPFGESILRPAYKTFKQKELLEDSTLIYRIARAPERRVFYIDVGKMRQTEREDHLRKIKNDFKQKKIPIRRDGKDQIESIYDPQSIQEDFFFGVGADGRGSRVETLPGGGGLGQLEDLHYWFAKLWRGLRVPDSYMNNMIDGGGVTSSDGRVGIAYMQEIKFCQYVERLQQSMEETLDAEFKRFLADMRINVDPSTFKVALPSPSNYADHKDLAIDNDRLANYGNADGIEGLSKRFAQTKYLQLTPEEQALNERLLREERGLPVDGGKEDLVKIYNPDIAEEMGFEGGIGGFGGGDMGGGDLDAPDEDLTDEDLTDEELSGGDEFSDEDTDAETGPEEGNEEI